MASVSSKGKEPNNLLTSLPSGKKDGARAIKSVDDNPNRENKVMASLGEPSFTFDDIDDLSKLFGIDDEEDKGPHNVEKPEGTTHATVSTGPPTLIQVPEGVDFSSDLSSMKPPSFEGSMTGGVDQDPHDGVGYKQVNRTSVAHAPAASGAKLDDSSMKEATTKGPRHNTQSDSPPVTNATPILETPATKASQNESPTMRPIPTILSINEDMQRFREIDPALYAPPPYEERPRPLVHSLSVHNRPVVSRRKLPIHDFFPDPVGLIWKGKFDVFNHLQSEVANTLAHSNDSLLVSAPTGAGKTALFEMAMVRHIQAELVSNYTADAMRPHCKGAMHPRKCLPAHGGRKIVYIAPSKALCDERYEDWTRRLGQMNVGIRCAMITGDADASDCYRELQASQVILTTPEKWDSLTRRWNENFFLFASVKLLLLDEVHLLADPSRGVCLESIVCRMKTIVRAAQSRPFSDSEIRTSR